MLTLVCGPAGAGKSTYAQQLAAETNACLLDSDTVTEPVVRAGLALAGLDPDDRDSPSYKAAFRDPIYECLYNTAAENLPFLKVVLVGPFTREIRDPEFGKKLADRLQTEVELIFVTCSEDERRRRIEQRGNPRDAPKLADWQGYLAGSSTLPPAGPHRIVNTSVEG